jgi:hypothetical protein
MESPLKYLYLTMFFTFWNILLVAFHKYTRHYVDLLYLSFVVLVVGFYLSFINPARFIFRFGEEKVYVTGLEKFVFCDLLSHLLIFGYVLYLTYSTKTLPRAGDVQLFVSILIIITYILIVDVKYVYGISLLEILVVFSIANLAYFISF